MAARQADNRRRRAERKGRLAEWVAAAFLLAKGYRLLAMRHRTPLGEIDLIVKRGRLVVFVEVKARRDLRQGLDAVSLTAARRIRAASDLWLARQPDGGMVNSRFDIVAVRPFRLPVHVPDAF